MYRRAGRGRVLLLAFVAISIVVVTLDFRQSSGGPLKRAKDLAVTVVAPVQRGFTSVTGPVGDFFSSVANLANLRGENERLEQALDQAQADADGLPAIEDENEELRAQLDLENSWRTMEAVTATVISSNIANYKWAIVIGKGRSDGIKPDMAAINSDGLVGKVLRSGPHYATVLLLVDPAAAAAAKVDGIGDGGLVEGNGGGEMLSLSFIDTDSSVAVGDEVVTSGLDGGVFPPGVQIGSVAEVGGSDAAGELQVAVESAVDFKALLFVTVLLETGDRLGAEAR